MADRCIFIDGSIPVRTSGSYALTTAPRLMNRFATSNAGEFLVSFVLALNARPNIPILFPLRLPPSFASTRSTTRLCARSLLSIDAVKSGITIPTFSAAALSAGRSFGRHEPPQPGPGSRKRLPIRSSRLTPFLTSVMFAPICSQNAATSFMKESRIANRQFETYLIISADDLSVITRSPGIDSKSSKKSPTNAESDVPTTIRSGNIKSCSAEPSLKNSGFESTVTSSRLTRSETK